MEKNKSILDQLKEEQDKFNKAQLYIETKLIQEKEFKKCKESPYYFFTNYLTVKNEKLQTFLTEQEFNKLFKSYGK